MSHVLFALIILLVCISGWFFVSVSSSKRRLHRLLRATQALKSETDDALAAVKSKHLLFDVRRLSAGFALQDSICECRDGLRCLEPKILLDGESPPSSTMRRLSQMASAIDAWIFLGNAQEQHKACLLLMHSTPVRWWHSKSLKALRHHHECRAEEFIERQNRRL